MNEQRVKWILEDYYIAGFSKYQVMADIKNRVAQANGSEVDFNYYRFIIDAYWEELVHGKSQA